MPFRIAVSVWGAKARNETLRGTGSYDRSLATATGDKRAMIYFTISRDNIDDIEPVVLDCVERGIPVCFQGFQHDDRIYAVAGGAGNRTRATTAISG